MSTSTNISAPVAGHDAVQSNGTYTGESNAALVCLQANIVTQQLGMSLQVIYSKMATMLAGIESEIQGQLGAIQEKLWNDGGNNSMANIQKILNSGGKLNDEQKQAISLYTTKLGSAQSAIQAGVKGIDPVLTPTQNMPQAIATSMNESMSSIGSVIQGMSFVAQCKILN